ncbi:MAG: DNA/RNA nuclease SfsA [Desulfovibrio sp.]|nr:DNA/RNA nuclease SfsA [Desulfovibrio sp.]
MTPRAFVPLPKNLVSGEFLRREKRFLIEARIENRNVWAHCNDSGAMTGLLEPGREILLSRANDPRRKLPYTLERIRLPQCWANVNTFLPNRLLEAAFNAGALDFASGYAEFRREVKRGASRLDARLSGASRPPLWIECKSATLVRDGAALFPDAPTVRGRKHLLELMDIVKNGERAAMFYLVQREDATRFAAADDIDPEYGRLFRLARNMGVEIHIFAARMSPDWTELGPALPVAD